MTNAEGDNGPPTAEREWWAEISYRVSSKYMHQPLPDGPQAARERLNLGNRSFARLLETASLNAPAHMQKEVYSRDVGLSPEGLAAPRQQPYAAVVGCADARVPVELLFSEGPNDLFVIRVAGNGLGDDVIGSLTYAVENLKDSLRAIVVLGHSQCGAISGAVDVHLQPGRYLDVIRHNQLRRILDRKLVVIQAAANWITRDKGADVVHWPGYRQALIEVSTTLNAALTAHGIRETLGPDAQSAIDFSYGVYLIDERLVWSPADRAEDKYGLTHAPTTLEQFGELCDLLVRSPRIPALLESH